VVLLAGPIFGCATPQGGIPDELGYSSLPSIPKQGDEYRIQSGDQLDIKLFYNPELNEMLTVRPDGRISLQLIGEIGAAGMTPSELVTEITKRYSKELRKPAVTINVKGFTGQQVFIDGEVVRPGSIDIIPGLTAWQAIIKAGGFNEAATRESVIVIRHGEQNRPVAYRLDLKSSSLDQPQIAFQLQPFDVVFVPKTWIAEQDKFVNQYLEKLLLFKGWYFNISPISPIIK